MRFSMPNMDSRSARASRSLIMSSVGILPRTMRACVEKS